MLITEIKEIKSDKADLRKFGYTFSAILFIIGGYLWWMAGSNYVWFLSGALLFLVSGRILPVLLLPVQKIWMTFAVILGWVMTRLILSVLFYFVFTFIGVILRMMGKDLLNRKIEKDKKSYWIKREPDKWEKLHTERQF